MKVLSVLVAVVVCCCNILEVVLMSMSVHTRDNSIPPPFIPSNSKINPLHSALSKKESTTHTTQYLLTSSVDPTPLRFYLR